MTEPLPRPAPQRRERKRQQLADRVAATAFGLFEELGYTAVTMERVAAAADIAKGTLYKYFPVKEALLAHHFQREIAAGMEPQWPQLAQRDSFGLQLRALLQRFAQWHEARRAYIAHYVRYQFSTSHFDGGAGSRQHRPSGARGIFERLCSAGQARGDVRRDLPAAQLAVMLECLCLGAIMIWLGSPQGGLQQQFDALLALALNGVEA